jgi:hypothetical protein
MGAAARAPHRETMQRQTPSTLAVAMVSKPVRVHEIDRF